MFTTSTKGTDTSIVAFAATNALYQTMKGSNGVWILVVGASGCIRVQHWISPARSTLVLDDESLYPMVSTENRSNTASSRIEDSDVLVSLKVLYPIVGIP